MKATARKEFIKRESGWFTYESKSKEMHIDACREGYVLNQRDYIEWKGGLDTHAFCFKEFGGGAVVI